MTDPNLYSFKENNQFTLSLLSSGSGGYSDRVTILLRCPPVSACIWCVKLYSTVLAGCIMLFSFLWIICQLYVLSQTEESTLRVQR